MMPDDDQELWCEYCDQPATAADWNPVALRVICQRCIEELAEEQSYERRAEH